MKVIVFVLCVITVSTLHISESHLAAVFPAGQIKLKSDIGTYLVRCNNCGPGEYPDSAYLQ